MMGLPYQLLDYQSKEFSPHVQVLLTRYRPLPTEIDAVLPSP